MPHDESAKQSAPLKFKIVEPKEGRVRAYANYSHLSWSGMDMTIQLYQFEQPNRELPENKDEPDLLINTASVTLTWAAAKSFHKVLTDALQRYEKTYGEINTDFKEI